jgi:hypothetical protein
MHHNHVERGHNRQNYYSDRGDTTPIPTIQKGVTTGNLAIQEDMRAQSAG